MIGETGRVLRAGGEFFLEEPSEFLIRPWDRLLQWGHPSDAQFRLEALELEHAGFALEARKRRHLFGFYRAVAR